MSIAALVLAGGSGERMRRSSGRDVPKPLVEVRGSSLLERNLCALVGAGLTRIWVACLESQVSIHAEVARFAERSRLRGVLLETLVEPSPRGTIGAAGLLKDRVETLLTVNADNLCALDLRALLEMHARSRADLTLASHFFYSQIPHGELRVEGDQVVAYREKPRLATRVCSAICALGPAALAVLEGRAGLPDLTTRLIEQGRAVRTFEHEAPWVDVNESGDLERAAKVVAENADVLERWAPSPDIEVVGAILCDQDRLLLERRSDAPPAEQWDTPGGKIEIGEAPAAALKRELNEELGLDGADTGSEVTCFDALDAGGRIVRHHVFELAARASSVHARENQTLEWFPRSALPANRTRVVSRSLAFRDGAVHGTARPGER